MWNMTSQWRMLITAANCDVSGGGTGGGKAVSTKAVYYNNNATLEHNLNLDMLWAKVS